MNRHSVSFRIIASITILALLFQNQSFAQTTAFSASPAWGTVSSFHSEASLPISVDKLLKSPPDVWIVEDAHTSLNAQLQIARIIETLLDLEPKSVVATEGLAGESAIDLLKAFPDKSIRTMAAYTLLKQSRISAAEYAAITSEKSIPVSGVENARLYAGNWSAYKQIRKKIEASSALYKKLSVLLSRLEKNILSRKLQRWVKALDKLDDSSQNEDWIEDLQDALKKLSANGLESKRLKLLLENKILPEAISAESWFDEINRVMEDIIRIEAQSELELKTVALIQKLRQISRVLNLKASRNDYLEILSKQEPLTQALSDASELSRSNLFGLFSSQEQAALKKDFDKALLFYRVAIMREKAMSIHLQQKMRAQKKKSGILVAGGFHTAGLTAQLSKAGLSVLVLRPRNFAPSEDREYSKRALSSESKESIRAELTQILNGMFGAAVLKGYDLEKLKQTYLTASHLARPANKIHSNQKKLSDPSKVRSLKSTIQAVNAPSVLNPKEWPEGDALVLTQVHSLTPSATTLNSPSGFVNVRSEARGEILITTNPMSRLESRGWKKILSSFIRLLAIGTVITLMSSCTSVSNKSQRPAPHLRTADRFYDPYLITNQDRAHQEGPSRIRLEAPPATLPAPKAQPNNNLDANSDITLTSEELSGFQNRTPNPNLSSPSQPELSRQVPSATTAPLPPSITADESESLTSSNYAQLLRIIVKDEKMMEGAVCPLCFLLSEEEKEELIDSGALPQINPFEDAFKTAEEALTVLFSYKGQGKRFSENERYKAVMYLSAYHSESTRLRALELLRDASRPDFTEGNKEFVRGIIVGAVQWVLFAGPNQEDIQALMDHGLSHPDNLVRFMTVRMLGKIAEKDPEQKVFNRSMREGAGQRVIAILQSDPDLFPVIAAAKALPELIGGEAATLYIDAALAREKMAKRYYVLDAAVTAAATYPSGKYVENLLEILKMKPPMDGARDANDRSKIIWNYQKLKLKARTALTNIYAMDAIGPGASNANQRKWDASDMFSVMTGTGDALHQFLAFGIELHGKNILTSRLRAWIGDQQDVMLKDPLPRDHEWNKKTAIWQEEEMTFRLQLEKKNPDKYKVFMRRAFLRDSENRLDTSYLMKHLTGAGIDPEFAILAAGLAVEYHALDLQEALAENVFFQQNTKSQTASLKALIYFSLWERDTGIMVYDSDYFTRLLHLTELALEGQTVPNRWATGSFWDGDWPLSNARRAFRLNPGNQDLLFLLYEIITGEKHPSEINKKNKSTSPPASTGGKATTSVEPDSNSPSSRSFSISTHPHRSRMTASPASHPQPNASPMQDRLRWTNNSLLPSLFTGSAVLVGAMLTIRILTRRIVPPYRVRLLTAPRRQETRQEKIAETLPQPSGQGASLFPRRTVLRTLFALAGVSMPQPLAAAAPWTPIEIPELPKSQATEAPSKIVLRTLWGWIQRSPTAQSARIDLQEQINEGERLKPNWSLSLLVGRKNGSYSASAQAARNGIDGLSFDLATAYESGGISLISNVTGSLLNRLFGVKKQTQEAQRSLEAAAYYRLQDALLLMYSEAANMLVELHYTRKKAALYRDWQNQLDQLKLRALANQASSLVMINQIDTMLGMAKTQAANMDTRSAEIEAQLMQIIAPSPTAVKGSIETSDADMQNALAEVLKFIPKKEGIDSPAFLSDLALKSQNHPSVLSAYFAFVGAAQKSALWEKRDRLKLDISLGGFLGKKSDQVDGPSANFSLPFTQGNQRADQLLTQTDVDSARLLVEQAQIAFAATYRRMASALQGQLKVLIIAKKTKETAGVLLPGGPWYAAGTDLADQMEQIEKQTQASLMILEAEAAALQALNGLEVLTPSPDHRVKIDSSQVAEPVRSSRSELRFQPTATNRQPDLALRGVSLRPGDQAPTRAKPGARFNFQGLPTLQKTIPSGAWQSILSALQEALGNSAQRALVKRAHVVDTELLDVNGLVELARSNPQAHWIFLFNSSASEKKAMLEKRLLHLSGFKGVLIQSENPFAAAATYLDRNKIAADSIAVGMDDRLIQLSEGSFALRVHASRNFWRHRIKSQKNQLVALRTIFEQTPPPAFAQGIFEADSYLATIADYLLQSITTQARTQTSV